MADPSSTGGITTEEIATFMSADPLPGSAGSSPLTRFVRKVATLVVARAGRDENGAFSVFLLSEALADDVSNLSCEEVPLLSNGLDPISDHVWISTSKLGTAFSCQLSWHDQGSLFTAVRNAGFGSHPALVVDWRGERPLGLLYSAGLDNSDEGERIGFDDAPISESELHQVIHRFWNKCIRTPGLSVEGHAMKIWSKATRGVPAERPEERIHGRLLDSMKTHFTRHDMRAEPPTDDGRIDIFIYSMTTTVSGSPAQLNEWVLELKALADRTSTDQAVPASTVTAAIEGGVEQAISYRGRTRALHAALCCFDMRRVDVGDRQTFAVVENEATQNGILLWRWFLYRSSAAGRAAARAAARATGVGA